MSTRQILVLGNLKGAAKAAIEMGCRELDAAPQIVPRADEAIRQLSAGEWVGLIAEMTTPGAARFCQACRAERRLYGVPLVTLSPSLTDLAFANAYRWGADDVIEVADPNALFTRLEPLIGREIKPPEPTRGEAIIADLDRSRCDVLGRVLCNAGYSVKYATDLTAARFYATKSSVKLFILNTELHDPTELLKESRAANPDTDWIIMTKQRELDSTESALSSFAQTAVMAAHGPPDNVLYAISALSPSRREARRAHVRALHGAVVLFRRAGEERDECGFTFSVSATGLYVRTLVPAPKDQKVWLELHPPGASRRVRLAGRVAWSRHFADAGAEVAPPGFGLEITDGLDEDLQLWAESFDALPEKLPDSEAPPGPTPVREPFRVPLPASASLSPAARSRARTSLIPARRSMAALRLSELGAQPTESTSDRPATKPRTTAPSPRRDPMAQLRPTRADGKLKALQTLSLMPSEAEASQEQDTAQDETEDTIDVRQEFEQNPAPQNGSPVNSNSLLTLNNPGPPPKPASFPRPAFFGTDDDSGPIDISDAVLQSLPPRPVVPIPQIDVDPLAKTQLPPVTDSEDSERETTQGSNADSDPDEHTDGGAEESMPHYASLKDNEATDSQTDPAIPGALLHSMRTGKPAPAKGTSDGTSDSVPTVPAPQEADDATSEEAPASVPPMVPLRNASKTQLGIGTLGVPPNLRGLSASAPPKPGTLASPPEDPFAASAANKPAPQNPPADTAALEPDAAPDSATSMLLMANANQEPHVALEPPPSAETHPEHISQTAEDADTEETTMAEALVDDSGLAQGSLETDAAPTPPPKDDNTGPTQRSATPPPKKKLTSEGSAPRERPKRSDSDPAPVNATSLDTDAPPQRKRSGLGWLLAALVIGAVGLLIGLPKYLGQQRAQASAHEPAPPAADPAVADTQLANRPLEEQPSTTNVDRRAALERPDPSSNPTAGSKPESAAAPATASTDTDTAAAATAPDQVAASTTDNGGSDTAPSEQAAGSSTQAALADSPVEDQDTDTEPPKPLDAPSTHTLSEGHGWLYVRSTIDTNVFVHGLKAGRTNHWLRVHCGPRYIRLGAAPGKWDSPGLPSKLHCKSHTVLTLNPK